MDFNGDGTASWREFGSQAASPSDYDADDDGLIEVDSLARLNAMRWDLDGAGISSDAGYLAEYPSSHAVQGRNLGCPSGCVGYELTASLDFDTNGSGSANSGDAYWDFGAGWRPIGTEASPFNAVFDGNGHVIANLFINRRDVNYVGLFGHAGPSAVIRHQALTGVSISGRGRVGGLAGRNQGMVTASYVTGGVSGSASEVGGLVGNNLRGSVTASYTSARVSGQNNVGGLVGWNQTGAVTASYATGSVSGSTDLGGLVGRNEGSVTAGYATGSVSGRSNSYRVGGLVGRNTPSGSVTASYATGSVSGLGTVGGLIGRNEGGGTITNSYHDGTTSGHTFGIGADDDDNDNAVDSGETNSLPGKTTAELHGPTGYTGVYAGWNVDIDDADDDDTLTTGRDDPWDFGTATQYPALKVDFDGNGTATWQEFGPQPGRLMDNDADDDGLIEVSNLAQLNAIRWDLDGNGAPAAANAGVYAVAFGHATADACAYDHDGNTNTPNRCVGYELTADLDFDTNGDGSADSGDAYWNSGAGWQPIGDGSTQFTAVFEGNGHTIANLFIARSSTDNVGLFGHAGSGAVIRNLELTGVSVRGGSSVGGLAGRSEGSITASYATGSVSGTFRAGGLVGMNDGSVTASYAAGSVTGSNAGGLAGKNDGSITASYATGSVTGQSSVGGLVGWSVGSVTISYATGSVSGLRDGGGLVGRNDGSITASYAAGSVDGTTRAGGLAGRNEGSITAGYATGSVTGRNFVGGLVGSNYVSGSSVTASYAAGSVMGGSFVGGLVGGNSGTVADSHYDETTSGRSFGIGADDTDGNNTVDSGETNSVPGKTTAELQGPLQTDGYAGIYANWNVDLDNADNDDTLATGGDDPWDFGTATQYPALVVDFNNDGAPTWQEFGEQVGRLNDYDSDDDGLIEVDSLAKLNAMRWDLDGDGTPAAANAADYASVFPDRRTGMGCPSGCAGYELTADLDFDEDGDGARNDTYNAGSGWQPIGNASNKFTAAFEGNGHTIANLFINRVSTDNVGLFGYTGDSSVIRNVGLTDVNVSGRYQVGALVGWSDGSVTASYATGTVTGAVSVGGLVGASFRSSVTASYATASVTGGSNTAGGLVGWNQGTVAASYATGSVTSAREAGGLVGANDSGAITASYATGRVTADSDAGGLVGDNSGTVTNSYYDRDTSGRTFGYGADDTDGNNTADIGENNRLPGKTTADLRTPTDYTGIYQDWNDLDADDNVDATTYWDFGTSNQYPALKLDFNNDGTATWQEFGPQMTGAIDYDTDNDGLIDVDSLARLNAIRWDLDGDGASNDASYQAAYPSSHAVQGRATGGCPSGCVGYELTGNLDFDANGDGTRNDAYNTGAGWEPIGAYSNDRDDTNDPAFTATFEGNGHVIANLFIDRDATEYSDIFGYGLFGHAGPSAVIRNLGLTGVNVSGTSDVGGLAGRNQGSVTASYAAGSVSGNPDGSHGVGGLVGDNRGSVTASYFTGSVSGRNSVGGLVGESSGTVAASYATGTVSGSRDQFGGLVGRNLGTVAASYFTGTVSGVRDQVGGLAGWNNGSITASYATGSVSGRNSVGGLVGDNTGAVTASYAVGSVSGSSNVGGLSGYDDGPVTASYYDESVSGRRFGFGSDDENNNNTVDGSETNRLPGKTTAELRGPTGYTGIYEDWNDLDGDDTVDTTTYWDFGGSREYPALKVDFDGDGTATWQEFGPQASSPPIDYDSDDDGLIEVDSLAKLNAMRWDLNGDGASSDAGYLAVYPTSHSVQGRATMGCPSGCFGYELTGDLDFDTGTAGDRTDDTYYNGGTGWESIGAFSEDGNDANDFAFTAVFEGNDHVIANLFIDRSATQYLLQYGHGLFGYTGSSAVIRNLGLTGASVSGANDVGALVGRNLGSVTASYAAGSVSGFRDVGGLVGHHGGTVTAGYATGSVSGRGGSLNIGGLVGENSGSVAESYAAGSVSSGNSVGGLVGLSLGTVTASYATGGVSGVRRVGGLVGDNQGSITAGHASGSVTGGANAYRVGGLVGWNRSTVAASYATGSVTGGGSSYRVGGLVGDNGGGTITDSYHDESASGHKFGIGADDGNSNNVVDTGETNSLPGKATAELRRPTGYTGIYADWNDLDGNDAVDATTYWDFGTARHYPALKVDFDGDGTATWEEFGPQPESSNDYDTNDDGLIEVSDLAQLNAIRWDLDGDGASMNAGYLAAYPSAHVTQGRNRGCPAGCAGYELAANLDFDTNGNGSADSGDDYWNMTAGWEPIGDESAPFAATFEGNGKVIANLFIHRAADYVGLFGHAGPSATIRNLGLTGVSISGSYDVGGLAGRNRGRVAASYVTGSVSGSNHVGGLVGDNNENGVVVASYATGSVSGTQVVGGLVGQNYNGGVYASYATNSVSGRQVSGGLVGGNYGEGSIIASYARGSVSRTLNAIFGGLVGQQLQQGAATNSYWDTETSGQSASAGGVGKTTAELRAPTGYTGIYADWNDLDDDNSVDATTYWDFGTNQQYPILKVDFNKDGTATWQEFGDQRAPEPVRNLSATRSATALTVTWEPPTGVTPSGYQYRVSQDGGETWGAWTDTPSASHTINNPPAATNYAVEVRLPGDTEHGPGQTSRIGPPGMPENLTLTPRNMEILARWRAPLSNGGSAITGYLVERDDGAGGSFTDAGHTGTDTMATITGLTNSQGYRVRVAARNVMGVSAYTMVETTRPSELPFVSIAPGASPVTEGTAAKFTILANGALSADLVVTVAVSGGEEFGVSKETRTVTLTSEAPVVVLEVPTTGDANAKSAADVTATVRSGTLYNAGAHNSASVRINDDDGGLNAPANFRAIPGLRSVDSANSPKVDLSWAAPPDSSAVTGYELQESTQADFASPTYTKILAASSASYEAIQGEVGSVSEDNNLHPNLALRQTNYFRIRAFTGAEGSRAFGPWSPTLRVRPSEFTDADIDTSSEVDGEVYPPGPPAPVTVVPGDQGLVVYWGIPADVGGNTIVAYDLQRRQGGDSGWTTAANVWTYGSGTLSHELDYLPDGETYEVRVRADSVVTANSCAAMGSLGQDKCLWAKGEWSATTTVTDYDTDEDRLIEVDSLAKLDAMRWDLNGDGLVDDTTEAAAVTGYAAAFPNRLSGMGCAHDDDNDTNTPTVLAPCLGYELTAALDFDTGTAGDRTDDDYHDGGKGWNPIGDTSAPYTGEFDGRGHTIANLFINRDNANDVGLFGALQNSTVNNLRLTGVNVTGVTGVGALAGRNLGDDSISGVAVSGSVSGASEVGGLVGKNDKGTVAASYAAVAVSATGGDAGGLVGESEDGDIRASYATGAVSGSGNGQGGLVGRLAGGSITASYATGAVSGSGANIGGLVGLVSDLPTIADSYWDTEASGRSIGVGSDDTDGSGAIDGRETETPGVTGQTTAALRGPLQTAGYAGIYANWNVSIDGDTTDDDPWDFGLAHNYPALKADFDGNGTATWQEFGSQREPGPVRDLNATHNVKDDIEITWTAPADFGSVQSAEVTYQYRVSADSGATWGDWTATDTATPTSHTIEDPAAGAGYAVEVQVASAAAHSPSDVRRLAPPGAPNITSLTVDTDVAGRVTVVWDAPASDGGLSISSYAVEHSADGNAWTAWTRPGSEDATSTTTTVVELPGGSRQFRVAAENLMGRGPYSTPGFATPLEPVLTISVVTGDETITEGEDAEFTVTATPRAFAASLDVTVKLSGGADFGLADGDRTFQLDLRGSSGDSSSANFSITTSNDVVDDPDSTITVTLEDTAGYALGETASAQVAVQDNDARPGAAPVQSVVPGGWQLTVSWTAPADPGYSDGADDSHTDNAVTAYDVRHIRSDATNKTDDDAWTVADDAWQTGGGDLTYTIGGLTAGTQYDVQVRAVTQAGDGDWSGTATGTPVAGDAMTVSLTPGVGQLRADWSAVAQATGYVVQWRTGEQQYLDTGTERRHVITDGSATTYTISSLTQGTRYWVRVTPTRSGEPDGAPSEANAVAHYPAPAQVQNVSVTAQPGALSVTWDRVNDADGYKVQWKSGSEDFGESRQAALDGRNITSHTIRGLLPGTQYTVRVIAARNHAADGQPSAVATGTPQNVAPASIPHTWDLLPSDLGEGDSFRLLFVTSGTRNATSSSISDYNTFVQNAANADGVDAVLKGFRTQFNALGCTQETDGNTNTDTTFTAQDKGLPIYWLNGAKVADDYQDFYDDTWNSNEPRNQLGQTFTGSTEVWTGCGDDGTEAFDGAASRALGGPHGDNEVRSADPKNNTRTISGINKARSEQRRLYALSPVLTVAGAPPGQPGKPSVTRTADAAGATAALTWDAPTDSGSSDITGYNVQYRGIQSGTCGQSGVVFTNWTDVSHTGTDATAVISMLAHSSHYQVQVRAVNSAGEGIWSSEAGFDTPHGPPTGVMGQPGSPGEAALSWTAPSVGNACNTDIDRYIVEYDDDSNLDTDAADTTPPQTAQTADGDTTTLTVSGLTAGTEHFFRARAENAVGRGASSTAVSVTPSDPNIPVISIAAANALELEGDGAGFTVTSSLAAPAGGLSVTVNVSGGSSFVAAGDRGDKTVIIAAGETSATHSVPTINTLSGTPPATANADVTAEVQTATGYAVHATEGSAAVTVVHRSGTTDAGSPTVGDISASRSTMGTTNRVTIQWEAPSGQTVLAYHVQQATDAAFTTGVEDFLQTEAEWNVDDNPRYFRVRPVYAARAGIWSGTLRVTPQSSAAPGKPAAPTVAPDGGGQLRVTWTAPADNGNTITSYLLRWRKTGNLGWIGGPFQNGEAQGLAVWNVARGGPLSHTLTGLDNDDGYDVILNARNAGGDAGWSGTATGTPTAGSSAANNAPAFPVPSYAFNLAENTDGSSTAVDVGIVSATDPDSGDTVSYSITAGNTGSVFAINSSNGGITYTGSGEDYESFATPAAAFSLTVTASDDQSPAATALVTVTIRVTNVNEPPGVPSLADQSATVGTAFSYQFAAVTDPEGATPTYTAEAVNDDDTTSDLPSWLTFTGDGGDDSVETDDRLFSGTPVAANIGTLTIRVTASDGASPTPATSSATFTLTVSAANSPPAFGADSYAFDLAENADGSGVDAAIALGMVSATDPDTGDTVEYSITAGNTGSVFAIDGSSGAITYTGTGEVRLHNTRRAFSLTVTASRPISVGHRDHPVTNVGHRP